MPVLFSRSSLYCAACDADEKDAAIDACVGAKVAPNPSLVSSVRDWEVFSSSSIDPTTITSVIEVASASRAGPERDRSGAFGVLRKYSRRRS